MDARVVQEAAGPGRFLLGFGTSKIFLNNITAQTKRTLGPMRDAVEIVRGVLGGDAFQYDGETWSADVPGAARRGPHAARRPAGLRRGDGAEDAGARRRDRRRLPDAVDHDAGLRRATRARTSQPTSTSAAPWSRRSAATATRAATARARSPACTWPTSSRTSAARPTRCSSWRRSRWRSSRRWPRRWSGADASRRRSR